MLYRLSLNAELGDELQALPYMNMRQVDRLEKDLENLLADHLSETLYHHTSLMPFFQERAMQPVLRKYEQNTFYDRNGRIIYTKNRGLTGFGFKTKRWREVKERENGTVEHVIQDDTQPRQPSGPVERTIVYEDPFDKCDRKADYAEAWAAFEAKG